MPKVIPAPTLQEVVQLVFSQLLAKLCWSDRVNTSDLDSVLTYLKAFLPPKFQADLYHYFLQSYEKVNHIEKFNEKHLMLCTQLYSEQLYMNEFVKVLPFLDQLNGENIKNAKFAGQHYPLPPYDSDDVHCQQMLEIQMRAPLHKFMSTFTNLTTFHSYEMCDNAMMKTLSKHCPSLEEVRVELCHSLDDRGVFYLSGHIADDDTFTRIRRGVHLNSRSVCRELKRVYLEYTMACTAGAAMLLHLCPKLEVLEVTPDVSIGDIFMYLHGPNPDRYPSVTCKYALTTLHSYLELEEEVLALITRTCPNLRHVELRCNGYERHDRNLLANLVIVPIVSLGVMNCNINALLWYLRQEGSSIASLRIQCLISAPPNFGFMRSQLQSLIMSCPNISDLVLKLGAVSLSADVLYSQLGADVRYFTSLKSLTLEGANLAAEDLKIFLLKSDCLETLCITFQNLSSFEDTLLYDILAEGALKNLTTFIAYCPLLTMAGFYRLISAAPKLRLVGPLSSWAISKEEQKALIRLIKDNNWDLNVEAPEMFYLPMI